MDSWDAFKKTQDLQENYSPYKDEIYIVDSPIANETIETTVIHFRNIVDNYSHIFCCLLARFYETLLIQIYNKIDFDVLTLVRVRLHEMFDIGNHKNFDAINVAPQDEFIFTIENGLQSIIAQSGEFDYMYNGISKVAYIPPQLFECFAKEMASVELEYVYSSVDELMRNDMQEAIIHKYGDPLEIEYLAHGNKLKDYDLKGALQYLDKMNNTN